MDIEKTRERIEALVTGDGDVRGAAGKAVDDVIEALDEGKLRVAEPVDGGWRVNAWVKQAILLYFSRCEVDWMGDRDNDALVYFDKLPVKKNYKKLGVR